MKKLVLLGMICALGFASCKKQETCATYSKATKINKTETHSEITGNF
jgi:hypothetical protein